MWKDIKGYEGSYQVSMDGQIKSLKGCSVKETPHGAVVGKILKPTIMPNGYCQVSLMNQGKREVLYVHRIVAEHFLAVSFGPTVNHIDGNKQNNDAHNLEYISYSENNQHAYDTGLKSREKAKPTFLSKDQIKEIRENGKYDSYVNMAKDYGVSSETVISNIIKGITWKNID